MTTQERTSTLIDALVLVNAVNAGDSEAARLMLATYGSPEETGALLAALAHICVGILGAAQAVTGMPHERILGAVGASLRG